LTQGAETTFDMLNHADMKFGTVVDEDGAEVELTHARFIKFLRSQDRRLRREAFEKLYAKYIEHKNTLGAIYQNSVKSDLFFARQRKYASALDAALHPDNVPNTVYDNLIKSVRANLPALHRYLRLRRAILGVPELHMYDLYVPLVREVEFKVPYEESRRIVLA